MLNGLFFKIIKKELANKELKIICSNDVVRDYEQRDLNAIIKEIENYFKYTTFSGNSKIGNELKAVLELFKDNVPGLEETENFLKNKKYDEKAIASLPKLIPQRMIFLLQYETQYCLAYYHNRLYHTEWMELDKLSIPLLGLDLDIVWENTIKQIVCGENIAAWDVNVTIEENIATETHRRKLITDIASLEKKVRSEKQLNRQIQLNEELKRMRKELEQIS